MRWNVTFEQGGESHSRELSAPNARAAEVILKQSYPDASVVEVEPLDGEADAAAVKSGPQSGDGGDPAEEALRARDALGPALNVIGFIVIAIGVIGGFVNAAHLPEQASGLAIVASVLSVWFYGVVSGLLILGVGAIVTYLHRIQAMMARDRLQ
ncbi:hypothetical protein [Thioalkalivibrio sp. ALE19]|uniref:hypothetical protein n=1 Tax=Thioalkalivibrio sp. ALE19 TaxID=1266909 RepID=UPI0012DDD5AE|nr:hypothetical protein [Thioalkalivibrio sp. ALE19]